MKKLFLFATLIALTASTEVLAYDRNDEGAWIRRSIRSTRARAHGYYARQPIYYPRAYHRGPHCLDALAAVGSEHATEAGALLAAQRVWMRQVSTRDGAMYADPTYAQEQASRCVRADAQDTLLGRAKEGVGAVNKICEFRAMPCKPEFDKEPGR